MFKRRLTAVLIVFCLWALIAAGKLVHTSVYDRGRLLDKSARQAWRESEIIPPRGKLLDSEGKVLAWTEIYFDLVHIGALETPQTRATLLNIVKKVFPNCMLSPVGSRRYLLKRGLSPDEIAQSESLIQTIPNLMIERRFERRYVDYPELRPLLGEVVVENDMMKGVSGLEKKYNEQLVGKPIKYIVMLDKFGNWVPGTWRPITSISQSVDYQTDLNLSELLRKSGAAPQSSNSKPTQAKP